MAQPVNTSTYYQRQVKRLIMKSVMVPELPSFNLTLSPKIQYLLMNQIIRNKQTGVEYKLLAQVGKGANAKVFKGENVATKEIVAIKRMNKMTEADANMAKKEVQLMKCLNHKNIVKWVDDFRDKGVWYIVLEFCGNGDLQTYKNRTGKIPEYNCKALVRGVLEALVEIHSEKKIVVEINKKKTEINKKKIAHRDLKLANILIDDNFQLKLADFGFSKDFQSAWMTTSLGTPITMAPEVTMRQKYNEKCDVWSLGVITYYLLYNKYPFMPEQNNIEALTNLVLNTQHKFDPNVQVSEAGKDFINQCLIKSANQRPYSHDLLNHRWWASLSKGMNWSAIRSETIKKGLDKNYDKQAETMLMNVFYGVYVQHTNKLINAFLINKEEIGQILPLFIKYYSRSKYIDYYCHLIVKRLHQLKNREIMLSVEKIKFSFTLAQVKETQVKFIELMRLIGDLNAVGNVNMAEELAIFLSEQTDKLLDSFNQEEVNEKITLFKQIAKFLTTTFDINLINIDWGKNEELKELQSPIYNIILKLNSQHVVDMINKKEKTDKDLEAIWTIQHHISQSNDEKKSYEMELARLVLKILEQPSNFNIDRTMQTDLLKMDAYQFNEIGFLNYE